MDLLEIPDIKGFEYVLNSRYVTIRPCTDLSLTGITIISLMEKLIWLQNLNSHGLIFFESFIQKIKQTTSQNFPIISEWIQKIGSQNADLAEFQDIILSIEFLTELTSLCTNFGLEPTLYIKENNIDLLYLSKELNITIWLYDYDSHIEIKNNPFNAPILLTLMQIEKPEGLEVSILYHEIQGPDTSPEALTYPYVLDDQYSDRSNLLEDCKESQTFKSFIKKTITYMKGNDITPSEESCERINREIQMLNSSMKRKWEFEDDLKELIEKPEKNPRNYVKLDSIVPEKVETEVLKTSVNKIESMPKFEEIKKKKVIERETEIKKNSAEIRNEFIEPIKKEVPYQNKRVETEAPKAKANKIESVQKVEEIKKKKDVERETEIKKNSAEIRRSEFTEPITKEVLYQNKNVETEAPKAKANKVESVQKAEESKKKKEMEREPEIKKNSEEIRRSEFIEPMKTEVLYQNKPENKSEIAAIQELTPKYASCSFCDGSALNAISLACQCDLCIDCLRSGANFSRCPSCQRELSDSELEIIFAFITSTFE